MNAPNTWGLPEYLFNVILPFVTNPWWNAAFLHRGRDREIPGIAVPPLGARRWVSPPHSEVTALKWTVYSGHVNSSDVYDALLCFKMFSFWVYLYTNSTYKEAYLIKKIIFQSYEAGRVIQTSLGRKDSYRKRMSEWLSLTELGWHRLSCEGGPEEYSPKTSNNLIIRTSFCFFTYLYRSIQ